MKNHRKLEIPENFCSMVLKSKERRTVKLTGSKNYNKCRYFECLKNCMNDRFFEALFDL